MASIGSLFSSGSLGEGGCIPCGVWLPFEICWNAVEMFGVVFILSFIACNRTGGLSQLVNCSKRNKNYIITKHCGVQFCTHMGM